MNVEEDIFKRGSTTYYFSSKFFPKSVRQDVFKLYSFVRTADDYVDSIPAQPDLLKKLETLYLKAIDTPAFNTTAHENDDTITRVVKNIVYVSRKYNFNKKWVLAFLSSMKQDLAPTTYVTIKDSLEYVYGSADVIGLMMAAILRLPAKSMIYAEKQGTAMQWINFIRDINEDNQLGRCYFPLADLKKFSLNTLKKEEILRHPGRFEKFIQFEIDRYYAWQKQADKGLKYIPHRLQIPLNAANKMYTWTAEQIAQNPMIIFEKKVKPSKYRVIYSVGQNFLQVSK